MKLENGDRGEEVWSDMQFNGITPDTVTYSTLLNLYVKLEKIYQAEKVWRDMQADRITGLITRSRTDRKGC